MISRLRYSLVVLVTLILAFNALAGEKPLPKVFEWIEQPVALMPLDSRVMYETVDGPETNYLVQELMDSIFVADIIGLLEEEEVTNFSLIPESVFKEDPEVIRLLAESVAILTSNFAAYSEFQMELSRNEYAYETEESQENFREITSINELAALLSEYTEHTYLAIPVFSGLNKDATMKKKKMLGNLGRIALQGALGGGNTSLFDGLGSNCFGMFVYDLRTGQTETLLNAGDYGMGFVKPKLLLANCTRLATCTRTTYKDLTKHNKKARKKIAKIEAKARKKEEKKRKKQERESGN